MIRIYTGLILLSLAVTAWGQQEFVQLSYGPTYSQMKFYTLSDDSEQAFFNDQWQIALTAEGFQDAGLSMNEAASLMGEGLEVWLAPTNDFDATISTADLSIQLWNPDSSWNVGAFNSLRDPDNQLDYGWGSYNPQQMSVVGDEVFVIRLVNGRYVKFMVESLALTTYNLKWADLDGSNEETMQIDKQQYSSKDLLLLNMTSKTVTPVSQDADLVFTRYNVPLDDGNGGILDYAVTGCLSLPGVTVAQASGVNPETVAWDDYKDSLDARIDVIGQDWKSFELSQLMWVIPDDVAYFVKDKKGDVWKVIFIDFEGSSTGNIVFTKEKVGTVSSIDQIRGLNSWLVFPNPVEERMQMVIEAEQSLDVTLQLVDMQGRVVSSWNQALTAGMINVTYDVDHLAPGSYQVVLSTDGQKVAQPILKK